MGDAGGSGREGRVVIVDEYDLERTQVRQTTPARPCGDDGGVQATFVQSMGARFSKNFLATLSQEYPSA
jgi:hypothetical protein